MTKLDIEVPPTRPRKVVQRKTVRSAVDQPNDSQSLRRQRNGEPPSVSPTITRPIEMGDEVSPELRSPRICSLAAAARRPSSSTRRHSAARSRCSCGSTRARTRPRPGCCKRASRRRSCTPHFACACALMASDGCDGNSNFDGFRLALTVPTEADAHKAFDALADGGAIQMPLTKTFWSPCYGMVTDRFGLGWMVMVPALARRPDLTARNSPRPTVPGPVRTRTGQRAAKSRDLSSTMIRGE